MNVRWGEQTALAVKNFAVSGERFPIAVIHEIAHIKASAARVNADLGVLALDPTVVQCMIDVAGEIAGGLFDTEFPVDVFQTGSGTSSNMNVNEVIAALVHERTSIVIHPNDVVNASQSSNDVVPSAVHVAAARGVNEALLPALRHLAGALRDRAVGLAEVVKIGRTHLMDAVPVTLGQELSGMARSVELGEARLRDCLARVMELPLGGTAVGTGLNAPVGFAARVIADIAERTGMPFVEATNHFEAQGNRDALVELSGMCRSVAISLYKAANDLRWMASGPIAGLGEIELPALQAGSSIMPGKVNPIIPEVACQVVAQVIGNDAAVAFAGASGNFELNVMIPVIARNVLSSIGLLANVGVDLAECVTGLVANTEILRERVRRSPMLATGLTSQIGYDEAKRVAVAATETGRTIEEVVVSELLLGSREASHLLDPLRFTAPQVTIPHTSQTVDGTTL